MAHTGRDVLIELTLASCRPSEANASSSEHACVSNGTIVDSSESELSSGHNDDYKLAQDVIAVIKVLKPTTGSSCRIRSWP